MKEVNNVYLMCCVSSFASCSRWGKVLVTEVNNVHPMCRVVRKFLKVGEDVSYGG